MTRGFLHCLLILATFLAGFAARQRASLRDSLTAEAGRASDGEVEFESYGSVAKGVASATSPIIDRHKKTIVRSCIRGRAEMWEELWTKVKMAVPDYPKGKHSRKELVLKVWAVQDDIDEYDQHVGWKMWKKWSSSKRKEMSGRLSDLKKELRQLGFDYDTAEDRCASSNTDEMYICMIEGAKKNVGLAFAESTVQALLAANELTAHTWVTGISKPAKKDLSWVKNELQKICKQEGYNIAANQKICVKSVGNDALGELYTERTVKDLSAGEVNAHGMCTEMKASFCPEGTTPEIGFLTSFGPSQCACLPRECAYDEKAGTCILEIGTSWPSSNPYGRALPYMGMKCVVDPRSANTSTPVCEMQECSAADYHPPIAGAEVLYGTLGLKDKNLYNCMSDTDGPGGAIAFKSKFAIDRPDGGIENTAKARNAFYRKIGLAPKGDVIHNTLGKAVG